MISMPPSAEPNLAHVRGVDPVVVTYGALAAVLLAFAPSVAGLAATWSEVYDYRHGYLVGAALLVWLVVRRREFSHAGLAPQPVAGFALAALAFAWLVAFRAHSEMLQQLLLPPLLACAVLTAAGPRAAWACAGPLASLYIVMPIWEHAVPMLQAMAVWATEAVMGAFGVPTLIQGDMITIPAGTFEVIEGCSGKRVLLLALSLATLVGAFLRLGARRGIALFLIAAAIAIPANWLRVIIVVTAGHLTDMQHYLVAVSHYWLGQGMNVVVVLLVCIIALRLARDVPPHRVPAGPAPAAPFARLGGAALVIATVGAAAGVAHWGESRDGAPARLAAPPAIDGWSGPILAAGEWAPPTGGADDQRLASWRREGVEVSAFASVYARQRQGRELVYHANLLLAPGRWQSLREDAALDGIVRARPPARVLRVLDPERRNWLLAYAYRVGDARMGSELAAQLAYGALAIVGEPPSGVLAVAARCGREDCADARGAVARVWDDVARVWPVEPVVPAGARAAVAGAVH